MVSLLSQAGPADVVDAHVALTAAATRATVLTSDSDDLATLAQHLPVPIGVRGV